MKLFKAVNSYSKLQIENEVEIIRKGILIVDDSKFSRNILKDILKTEGHLIVGEAGDGLEAVDMAREKKPEYIFMDVEMPKLDGLGAIPRILECDPKIKIVMCTALGQKNIILEAAKAGAKDYILKPYIKDNIISVLNELADKNQKEGQVIPFKSGKNHHDGINYKPVDDKEYLQPLENNEDNEMEEDLEAFLDQESQKDNTLEEIIDSYLNEELPDMVPTEDEAEPQGAVVKEVISEEVETVEVETVEEGKLEEGIVIEETQEHVKSVEEDKLEEGLAIEEIPEGVQSVEEDKIEEGITIDEISEVFQSVEEDKLEEGLAIKEIPEGLKTVAESESEEDKIEAEAELNDIVIAEIPEDDETEERAKFVVAVLKEETSKKDETVVGAGSKEVEAEPEAIEVELEAVEAKPEAIEAELEAVEAEPEAIEAELEAVEAEPEATILKENTSEEDTTEVEAIPEAAISKEDTSEDDTTAAEAEPEITVLKEDTSEDDTTAVEVILEEDRMDEGTSESNKTEVEEALENIISTVKSDPDMKPDNNSYTYLWNSRFDLLQKEINPQNSVGQRVSFYEYAYIASERYDTFRKDDLKRDIALGMMKAYMSLDNRLQQNELTTSGIRTLTYIKENRFFTSNILEESNNKLNEITIADEIKYNSLKPKQITQEITVKTCFYQFLSGFVNGKSGRILR